MIEIMGYLTAFFVMWMVIIFEETHLIEMSRKMKKRYSLGLYDNKEYRIKERRRKDKKRERKGI